MTHLIAHGLAGSGMPRPRPTGWLGALLRAAARELRARRAIAQLMEIDDYLLRDIGLSRDQVDPAVRGKLASVEVEKWRV